MKQDWKKIQLADLCEIQLGKTPHRKTDKFWDKEKESNNVWLSIADMKHGAVMHDSKEYVSDLGAEIFKITPKGTLMLTFKLTLGRVAFAGSDLLTNEAIASLINLDGKIDKRFLFYYFTFFDWNEATRGDEKVKGKTLNKTKLKKLPIIVPPLEEQKQIVAKLDQCFEAIDKAKANAAKNLENAKELFQSKLNDIFSQKGEGWVEKRLIDISKFIDYRGRTPKKTTEGVRLITAKNVKMGVLNRNPQEFIHTDGYDNWMTRGIPNRNDVLFTTEAPLANVALLDTDERVALAQRIITLSVNQDIVSGEYLCYCMQSKYVQDKILAKGTGATVTGIKAKLLKEINIPVVDHKTQAKFVNNLNKLKEQTQSLESKYQQALNSLEELKKSILQKAFEGEL